LSTGGIVEKIRFRVPVALMTAILPPYAPPPLPPLRRHAPPSRPCPPPTTGNRVPTARRRPFPFARRAVQHTSGMTRITSRHEERATCSPLSPSLALPVRRSTLSPFSFLPFSPLFLPLHLPLSLFVLSFSQKGVAIISPLRNRLPRNPSCAPPRWAASGRSIYHDMCRSIYLFRYSGQHSTKPRESRQSPLVHRAACYSSPFTTFALSF